MEIENIFRKYQLKNGESELLGCGDLMIRIKRDEHGWIINQFNKNDEEPEGGEFYQSGSSDTVICAPALQNKPLVFKGNSLSIMPDQKLTFFIKIPLIIQVYHTKKLPVNLMKEITHTRLSDTWFGEPDKGEAGYSIGADFKMNQSELKIQNCEAICPIQVYNNWDSLLELQRLILRVENMTLYEADEKVYTSLIKIEYKGKDNISSADYGTSKMFHGEKPQVVAKPRNDGSSPLKINFHFIRNIYKNM